MSEPIHTTFDLYVLQIIIIIIIIYSAHESVSHVAACSAALRPRFAVQQVDKSYIPIIHRWSTRLDQVYLIIN